MLQAIRDKAQGWIAWVIVILITIPFALWGIQEYLGTGDEPAVAAVDGDDITERELDQRARRFRENLRLRLGSAYRPDLISEEDLRNQVTSQIIDERVLLSTAENWSLTVGDAAVAAFIRSVPAFQRDGRFDNTQYETVLRNQGLSRPLFERSVRQDLIMNQIRSSMRDSAFATRREVAESARLEKQQRNVGYALVPADEFADAVEVTEDALQAHYQARKADYLVPEEVSVQYLSLDVREIAAQLDVSDEDLRSYYEQHTDEFRVPDQRKMRHILLSVSPGADPADKEQALAKISSLRARILEGEDFAVVARENSEDPGSGTIGGDLGWVEPGMMVAPFEEAGFALAVGTLSEPVLTDYGYHLIEVTEVKSGSAEGFDEIREAVESAYRRVEAENRFYDQAERLATLTYENPGTLAPAAENIGLEVRTTKPFNRLRGSQELNSPKVVNAAFSTDVLENGNNSDVVELTPDHTVVLRVLEHNPEHFLAYDDVRDKVEASYRVTKASEAAKAAAQAALNDLATSTQSLKAIAESKDWRFQETETVTRDRGGLPSPVLELAFSLTLPDDGGVATGVVANGSDHAIVELRGITDGALDVLEESERNKLAENLRSMASRGELEEMLAALRAGADIQVFNTR